MARGDDEPLQLTPAYAAFLDARCRLEIGLDFEDAMIIDPGRAREILADVALHRWPHLRKEAS